MRLTDRQMEQVVYNNGYEEGRQSVVNEALDVKVDTLRTDRVVVWFDLEYWKSIDKGGKR